MWDNDIAWHYGFAANGRGYAMFSVKMAAMRTEIAAEGGFGADEIDHHFQGLYGPSKTAFKLMDEFNWMTITRHIQPGA